MPSRLCEHPPTVCTSSILPHAFLFSSAGFRITLVYNVDLYVIVETEVGDICVVTQILQHLKGYIRVLLDLPSTPSSQQSPSQQSSSLLSSSQQPFTLPNNKHNHHQNENLHDPLLFGPGFLCLRRPCCFFLARCLWLCRQGQRLPC